MVITPFLTGDGGPPCSCEEVLRGSDLLVEPSPGHPLTAEEWLYGQVQVTQNGPVFLRLLGARQNDVYYVYCYLTWLGKVVTMREKNLQC